ncbi:pentapeptide repeat-containing protein, partial [Roseibium sp. RKSG952]|uniref:pentapeptide repeat-containing protein n=1 Tax=Roseibium sp. RKSG952 TaxID=2529384 RepID=UPI0013C9662A
ANCERADFSDAILLKADFTRAVLDNAKMHGCILRDSKFVRARMRALAAEWADFSNALLQSANLSAANLHGSNFQGARVSQANFKGAELTAADFSNARLRGAIFSPSVAAQLLGAGDVGEKKKIVKFRKSSTRVYSKMRKSRSIFAIFLFMYSINFLIGNYRLEFDLSDGIWWAKIWILALASVTGVLAWKLFDLAGYFLKLRFDTHASSYTASAANNIIKAPSDNSETKESGKKS